MKANKKIDLEMQYSIGHSDPKLISSVSAKPVDKYRDWDIYDKLPNGWFIDLKTASPVTRAVFIRPTQSPLKANGVSALL